MKRLLGLKGGGGGQGRQSQDPYKGTGSLWLKPGKNGRPGMKSPSKRLVGCLGLGPLRPDSGTGKLDAWCVEGGLGGWQAAGGWGVGQEVGAGGGGVRVSHRLGRGLYLVGTAASYGRELRTHMFLATNSHMCIHMHCARVSMTGDWELKILGLCPSPHL